MFEVQHGARGCLAVQGGSFHLPQVGVLVWVTSPGEFVTQQGLKPRQAGGGVTTYRAHLPPRALGPGAGKVAELAWEILVNNKYTHQTGR